MTSLRHCFIISVSLALYMSTEPVQGRAADAKKPSGTFHKVMADEENSACFSAAVGVANPSVILDKQITASSHANNLYQPAYGRLDFNDNWCTKNSDRNDEWLQVDLGQQYEVCGVATQGDNSGYNAVTAFKLHYSKDGNTWEVYKNEDGTDMEFTRNGNSGATDYHKLKPINARFIRFNPTQRNRWNCLRVEVYGKISADALVCFSKPVGVANPSVIPDKQMTASTHYSSWGYQPAYGRLNSNRGDSWCASSPGRNDEWLQVDLGKLFELCGVATQGSRTYDEWVTTFKLSYSQDGNYWTTYEVFSGYKHAFYRKGKGNGVDKHILKPVYARFIRFNPTQRHAWNCLRVEVYGKDAESTPCFTSAVGVANPSIIPDQQITASSYYGSIWQPANGRLNSKRGDGWCSRSQSGNNEWLQVDLGQQHRVCGVATQGDSQGDGRNEWVTAFKLSYSQLGKYWTVYKDENGKEMEFHRNGESNGIDYHKLNPIYARFIRFNPTRRHAWNCLRVEVYGKSQNLLMHNMSRNDCGVKWTKRIVGGQHASPGEWRWHVALFKNGRYNCGGSLLTPEWVITAAHCVEGKTASDISVTLGQHTRSQSSGKEQKRSINKLILHPQYKFPKYDIALLKLEKPATINDHVGTICLPQSTEKLPVGTVLWQTGWGRTGNGQLSDVLKELEIVVAPRENVWWVPNSPSEFITTATQQGHGHCQGDSGGPVVAERNGRWYLEGLVSWTRGGCGTPGTYDGQADVRAVLLWITDTIKNN